MDSTAQTALMDSEIINENRVAVDLEILNETTSTGDAWIRQRKKPLWPQKIINETASTGDAWIRQRKKPKWLQK